MAGGPGALPPQVVTPGPRGPVPSRPTDNSFISMGRTSSSWRGCGLALGFYPVQVQTSLCGVTHRAAMCPQPGCWEKKQDADRIWRQRTFEKV